MFKKLLSITMAMVLSLPLAAGASDHKSSEEPKTISAMNFSEKQLDQVLKKVGFPESLIDSYPIEVKRDWVESGVTKFEGQISTYYVRNDKTKKLEEVAQIDTSNGIITPQATIPSTDLVIRITKASTGTRSWTIKNEIEWLNGDYFMSDEDTLTTAWNSKLRAYGNTLSCRAFSWRDDLGLWGEDSTACGGQPYDISEAGVAWKVDFWDMMSTTNQYKAYTTQTVYVADGSTSGTASAYSKYAHDTSYNYSIGVNIDWVSISYNSSGTFDQASKQLDWSY
ncbi:hypothetical protein [Brevibacillus dissolubilis]|uniref:hypothetical protein n=1 Tax=Brevibacillus dissolubilis TaxID=1844116 RepID=UPI0011160A2C|nr:hypothetical protein [Brevibacillus dissolubilis]